MIEITKDLAMLALKTYQVDKTPLFFVGTFDTGVTVFSQQTRALNLAWAAVESDLVTTNSQEIDSSKVQKIAIIGAGFSGLSIAAGLLSKGVSSHITIFEQRDTLLPLQQGSDSRWLHPRIYDWPKEGSQASVAMLPILNWTAGRASDVVVQVLAEWKKTLTKAAEKPTLFCNTRHLQIQECESGSKQLKLEWVGEERAPADGTTTKHNAPRSAGCSEKFDLVILTIGFGVERDGALSYWRNETIGQPSLDKPRSTYIVSGQGDGAMIDVLRLRISQYRQDRILEELFNSKKGLFCLIQNLHSLYSTDLKKEGLFAEFEALAHDVVTASDFKLVIDELSSRLRRDTEVILHLKVRSLAQLFEPSTSRISFQNKILIFFLYKCGGFTPSTQDEEKIIEQHSIHQSNIVRRHGTERDEQLKEVLSSELYEAISKRETKENVELLSQPDKPKWPGGYFDAPGKSENSSEIEDTVRASWRKEYLPGAIELMATTLCAAISGLILSQHDDPGRLRVTLHRAISFGNEELLQQACDYEGTDSARGSKSAAARTFPARNGTIGIAYRCRKITRSIRTTNPLQLSSTMEELSLNTASRKMSDKVKFVLAIPLLESVSVEHTYPSPVAGVIYIDSDAESFFIDDVELQTIVRMASELLNSLVRAKNKPFDRIRNIPLSGLSNDSPPAEDFPSTARETLELVSAVAPPESEESLYLNYDYSDSPLFC